jgi:protein-S-isoprenylcysteine O-methyltransferase Ste14
LLHHRRWIKPALRHGRTGEARAQVRDVAAGRRSQWRKLMNGILDSSNAVVRPPLALALAVLGGLVAERLISLPFLPESVPRSWAGIAVLALGLALGAWAITTLRRAGTRVETTKPTTTIVTSGPYRLTRNPIYVGMVVILIGLAIALNTAWLLVALVPFYLVIRYGVIAPEEAYLERKFGDMYLSYKSRVRRWI